MNFFNTNLIKKNQKMCMYVLHNVLFNIFLSSLLISFIYVVDVIGLLIIQFFNINFYYYEYWIMFPLWLLVSLNILNYIIIIFVVFIFFSILIHFIYFWVVQILLFLGVIIAVLISVAYLTLAERKIMAAIQRRVGPNVVGLVGLFQPLADGLKLVVKQTIIPNKSQRFLFLFAPVYSFALALSAWAVIPFAEIAVVVNIELGVIYLLCISTLSVYGLIIAGWSSNSKYAFLGALRSAAQIISYDVSIGLILLSILLCVGSCNLTEIVRSQSTLWYICIFWPLALMFFISALAETNRSPFDLTEAEAELVSGYNVEYAAVGFALFFLAEYSNLVLISCYIAILFFGGWLTPLHLNDFILYLSYIPSSFWLGVKTAIICFVFIWVRASLPRFRYDHLMILGWKVFLPVSLSFFIFLNTFVFFLV